jgi:hypothetical protein
MNEGRRTTWIRSDTGNPSPTAWPSRSACRQAQGEGRSEHLAVFSGQKVSGKLLNTSDKPVTSSSRQKGEPTNIRSWRSNRGRRRGRQAGDGRPDLHHQEFLQARRYHYDIKIEGEPEALWTPSWTSALG